MEKQPQRFSTNGQVWLIILFILLSQVVGSFLFVIIRPLFGEIDFENTDFSDTTSVYVLAVASQLALFLSCFILFLRIMKFKFRSVIRWRKFSWKYFGYTIGLLVAGAFVAEGLSLLNRAIIEQFPSAGFIEAMEEMNERYRQIFDPSKKNLMPIAIVVFAVLPAIVEELIFRGLLMKKLIEVSGKPHFGVIVSALIFAAVHMQAWNLLPMIALGALLGYIYYYFQDIRYSMILHFLFNASQIVIAFYFAD